MQAHNLDMSDTQFRFAYNLFLLTMHTAIDTLVDACGPNVPTMSFTAQAVCARAALACAPSCGNKCHVTPQGIVSVAHVDGHAKAVKCVCRIAAWAATRCTAIRLPRACTLQPCFRGCGNHGDREEVRVLAAAHARQAPEAHVVRARAEPR